MNNYGDCPIFWQVMQEVERELGTYFLSGFSGHGEIYWYSYWNAGY